MNYSQAMKYIGSFGRKGASVQDLSRIGALLSLMDNPQERSRFIHVAGTNGKGSVVTMCAAILEEAGYRVGKFTSPYVIEFRERIEINGEPISEEDFAELCLYVSQYESALTVQGYEFSQFEIINAIAFEYFARQECDIVCLEAGIGGRVDSTNIITSPLVSVITTIAHDHNDLLGDTIEEIAQNKAGIIKDRCAVVVAPMQNENALAEIMAQSLEKSTSVLMPSLSTVKTLESGIFGSKFSYGEDEYEIRLAGEHQIINAITAIETIHAINKQGYSVDGKCIKKGLARASIAARAQILSKKPLIILDGAHNPNGMRAMVALLDKVEVKRKIGIIGMVSDKNAQDSLAEIAPILDEIIFVEGYSDRELSAVKLAEIARNYTDVNIGVFPSVLDGVRYAHEIITKADAAIITGSLLLASSIEKILAKK